MKKPYRRIYKRIAAHARREMRGHVGQPERCWLCHHVIGFGGANCCVWCGASAHVQYGDHEYPPCGGPMLPLEEKPFYSPWYYQHECLDCGWVWDGSSSWDIHTQALDPDATRGARLPRWSTVRSLR